jgi:hypothetical protein
VAVRDLQAGRAGHDYRRERRSADAAGDAATFLPPPPAAAEREGGAGDGVRCVQLARVFEALCSGVPGGGGGVALRLVMGRTLQAQPPAALIFIFMVCLFFKYEACATALRAALRGCVRFASRPLVVLKRRGGHSRCHKRGAGWRCCTLTRSPPHPRAPAPRVRGHAHSLPRVLSANDSGSAERLRLVVFVRRCLAPAAGGVCRALTPRPRAGLRAAARGRRLPRDRANVPHGPASLRPLRTNRTRRVPHPVLIGHATFISFRSRRRSTRSRLAPYLQWLQWSIRRHVHRARRPA